MSQETEGIVLELHHDPMDDILTPRERDLRTRSIQLVAEMVKSRVQHGQIRTDLESELAQVSLELEEIGNMQRERSLQITPGVFETTCVLL